MSQDQNHSLRKVSEGTSLKLSGQITDLIGQLPESCQLELLKGFTGDLLQLSVKVQEIQATNSEAREHMAILAELLNAVQRDGNRGHIKHTSQNSGGSTTIEIATKGVPIIRPVGGGCALCAAGLVVFGSLVAAFVIF